MSTSWRKKKMNMLYARNVRSLKGSRGPWQKVINSKESTHRWSVYAIQPETKISIFTNSLLCYKCALKLEKTLQSNKWLQCSHKADGTGLEWSSNAKPLSTNIKYFWSNIEAAFFTEGTRPISNSIWIKSSTVYVINHTATLQCLFLP